MCVICALRNPRDTVAVLDMHLVADTRSYAPVAPPPAEWQPLVTQLTDGYWEYWGGERAIFQLNSTRTLTYNVSGLSAAEQAIAKAALESWTEVTGIKFVLTTSVSAAKIVFDNNDLSGAYAEFDITNGFITKSYVNIPRDWDGGYLDLNGYMLQTYIHEIGHALGLGHAGNYNGTATYGVDNLFENDSWATTIMSYFSQFERTGNPDTFAWLATVMPADIMAIQSLYGFTGITNGGSSTYGYGSNIGGYLQKLLNQATGYSTATTNVFIGEPLSFTIYDTNGIDTINFSNFTMNQEITLVQLGYSDIGGLVDNVVIAYGTVIENAISGAGNDTLTGNGVANILRSNAGADSVSGDGGNDTIYGGVGDDMLYGGSGNDILYGETGNNTLNGGSGDDLYFIGAGSNDYVMEEEGGGFDIVRSAGAEYYMTGGVENLIMTATTGVVAAGNELNNRIEGGTGSDVMNGNAGSDTLYGGSGNDRLIGSSGLDLVYGGSGNDQIEAGTDRDTAFGGLGNDIIYGEEEGDRLFGESGNDRLYGGGDDDMLFGGVGNDILYGGSGNDLIYGDSGVDRMEGGEGDDTYTVDSAGDLVVELGDQGTDTVRTNLTSITLASNVENLILLSSSASTGRGNELNNQITGGIGSDSLYGFDGFDTLTGGSGSDFMDGGNGLDDLYGGNGNDRIYGGENTDQIWGESGNDVLYGGGDMDFIHGDSGNDVLYGGGGDDFVWGDLGNDLLYGGSENDFVSGSTGNDRLYGDGGDDLLAGDEGNDIIVGGDGSDILLGGIGVDQLTGGVGVDNYNGGAGADRFIINTVDTMDFFQDFTSGEDKVVLSRSALGLSSTATLSALWETGLSLPTNFADGSAVLFYDSTSGILYLDNDGGSSGNASALFQVQGGGTLAVTDLLFG